MRRRVVVTGLGVLTPVGNGVDAFWQALLEGKSGISRITSFDPSGFPTQIAGEVKGFNPEDYMDRKDAKRMDRFAQFAVAGAKMALEDAGVRSDNVDWERVGVLIGSGIGGIHTFEEQCRNLIEKGPDRVSPFFVPMMIPDIASGHVSIITGAKAHNSCSVTACASGSNAIGDAFRVIQHGAADMMITGGTEAAISPLAIAGFSAARALSRRNHEPERASRPFDKDRDGFVMGEGVGIVILEELEHARARGARIYAELVGYGCTGDAYHITMPAPQGDGARRAMEAAIKDSGLDKSAIGYINAHGTSTEYNDKFETMAIKAVFGERAYSIAVSSTKSMTGHLLGAAGGVEMVASVLALYHQKIPPTINLETPDPECDLDYVPNTAREAKFEAAMSNSFGFGGHNAVLVLRRMSE